MGFSAWSASTAATASPSARLSRAASASARRSNRSPKVPGSSGTGRLHLLPRLTASRAGSRLCSHGARLTLVYGRGYAKNEWAAASPRASTKGPAAAPERPSACTAAARAARSRSGRGPIAIRPGFALAVPRWCFAPGRERCQLLGHELHLEAPTSQTAHSRSTSPLSASSRPRLG